MNQVLGKLKKEPCTDNPHPDNREYTVVVIFGIVPVCSDASDN
jgi:hypothetical protein